MAIILIGEVVNTFDSAATFNQGNISTDDDKVQGTGAVGIKASNAYRDFYTSSLGVTAPYNFSIGGAEEGWHGIMYFGAKSPLNAVAGQRIIVGNGVSRGEYYVPLTATNEPKKGIFVSRVIDFAQNFDRIAAGSWTLTGNPSQLNNVTQMGGGLQSIVSIMGSFNNVQCDQLTIGLGLRIDGGTVGTPNTFELLRAEDEDNFKWGFWSSVLGAIIGKAKAYIGSTTNAVSVFIDTNFKIIFADERVAVGFYEINLTGSETDVTWTLGNISTADSTSVRWDLTVESATKSFNAINCTLSNGRIFTLNTNSSLQGTTLIDINSIIQNNGILDGCTILDSNILAGESFITSDNPSNIKNCIFNFNGGHAIEITTPGVYTFDGNVFNNFGTTGSNTAAIYNNSGGAVTLNIINADVNVTYRNGAGSTTSIPNIITLNLTNLVNPTEVRVYDSSSPTTEIGGTESISTGTFTLNIDADLYSNVNISILDAGANPAVKNIFLKSITTTDDINILVQQQIDRQFFNP